MIKNSFSPEGIHTLCDRCRKILATDFNFLIGSVTWKRIKSPRKGREGHNRVYDFCDEKCLVVYFRGKKYYNKKLFHISSNKAKEQKYD
jgi:hypothetical protein